MERYKVVDGSISAHCCFQATVVDTRKPVMVRNVPYIRDGEPQFESVCECFEVEDAELICAALNARGK
jgi:hypothetical protein